VNLLDPWRVAGLDTEAMVYESYEPTPGCAGEGNRDELALDGGGCSSK
jgi:hypothetical protein